MTQEEFLNELSELLELYDDLKLDTRIELESIEVLSIIAFLDENFGVKASAKELDKVKTVQDILNLVSTDKVQ